MNIDQLIATTQQLFANDRGLLAMDESIPTCNRRFAPLNIPQTVEARRAWRELIVTTPGLGESIGGAILCDETIRQQKLDGTSFLKVLADAGILPGIKVDRGTTDLAAHPGEKVTEGLDGLRERLREYFQMGARFAKWRAVLTIGDGLPSRSGLEANAHALARFAALCQEAGLVPIVEPEVMMTGNHTLEVCRKVTEEVLRNVFIQLNCQRVLLEGIILKPNMILPGLTWLAHPAAKQLGAGDPPPQPTQTQTSPPSPSPSQPQPRQEQQPQQPRPQPPVQPAASRRETEPDLEAVANVTVKSLWRTVPAAVPAIAFLSGGQPPALASARLYLMNLRFKSQLPWALSFSFARAIQQPALDLWRGQSANLREAQQALLHRAQCNRAARRGTYSAAMEQPHP